MRLDLPQAHALPPHLSDLSHTQGSGDLLPPSDSAELYKIAALSPHCEVQPLPSPSSPELEPSKQTSAGMAEVISTQDLQAPDYNYYLSLLLPNKGRVYRRAPAVLELSKVNQADLELLEIHPPPALLLQGLAKE